MRRALTIGLILLALLPHIGEWQRFGRSHRFDRTPSAPAVKPVKATRPPRPKIAPSDYKTVFRDRGKVPTTIVRHA